MAEGIKIPVSYEYNEASVNRILDQFNKLVDDAKLPAVFDAEVKNIREKFKFVGEEIKKQLESGKIDVKKLGLSDLQIDIEKLSKGIALVFDEALDDTDIKNYSKEVTKLGDEIINKQNAIKQLQKERKEIEDERVGFKAKFGLARMPTLDPLEAERRLAAAEAELSASGGGGSDELKQRIEMFKELVALMEKEQGSRASFYAAELEKAKQLAKESKDEVVSMITMGKATPGKDYAPVLFERQEKKDNFRQENLAFLEALAKGDDATVAEFYENAMQQIGKLKEIESERAEKAVKLAELKEQETKYFAEQATLMQTVTTFEQKRVKAAKEYNAANKKMTDLRTRNEGPTAAGISMQPHNFGGAFFKETGGLSKEELRVPLSVLESEKSIIDVQAKIKEARASGNKEQEAQLKEHLKVLKDYKKSYIEMLQDLGEDTSKEYAKSIVLEQRIGQTRSMHGSMKMREDRGRTKLEQFREQNESGSKERFETEVNIDGLDNEIALLKERQQILESTRVIQKEMAEEQMAAREDFQAKFGISAMPTGSVDEAKQMLGAAEEEMSKGAAGDPDLQNKVNLYKQLVGLLEKEKQTKEEINAKITDAQSEIAEKINQKKQIAIKLQEKQNNLGDEANNVSRKNLDLNTKINEIADDGIKITQNKVQQEEKNNDAIKENTKNNEDNKRSLISRAGATFSYGLIISQLRRIFRETLQTLKELDKAMTSAAIVTNMNRKEAYELLGAYQQLARRTGLATSQISGVVVEFLKQGRTMKDAMELAEVAAKSAKVAGVSAEEAVKFLTSAVNGFGLAASQAESIADKFSAVAASSATDFNELATAMSKVSPVAKSAGVGVDFMMGVLAKGLETTREAPENIGTAFKTIFARMREVTDIGKATEDGMSLNRVEKALESIGVPLRDAAGQFRNLETVLIDVGEKWDTLTSIEQAYIATSLAGTRQQPRLLAIFNDFARTKELIQISTDATGALAFQHIEYMQGAEAALAQLKTAWEGFVMAFTEVDLIVSSIQVFADVINILTGALNGMADSGTLMIAVLGFYGLRISSIIAQQLILMKNMRMENILKARQIALDTVSAGNKKADFILSLSKIKLSQTENILLAHYNELIATGNILKAQEALIAKEELITNALTQNGLTAEILLREANNAVTQKQIALSIKAAAASLLAMIKVAAVLALIAGVAWLIYAAFKEANLSVADFAKGMAETNKELNDLNEKEKKTKNLVKRFEELNRKIIKTTDDLRELNSIAEELSEVKVGEQAFNITRIDPFGNLIFDKVAYENFLRATEAERIKLMEENLDRLNKVISRKGLLAFDNAVIAAQARDVGFDFGVNFLRGFTKSFSEEVVDETIARFRSAMENIPASVFMGVTIKAAGPITMGADNFKDFFQFLQDEGKVGQTISFEEYGDLVGDYLVDVKKLQRGSAEFNRLLQIGLDRIKNYGNLSFDEDFAEEFAQQMGGLLLNLVNELSIIEGTTTQILTNRLEAYRDAITAVRGSDLSDEEIRIQVLFLEGSFQDEAIMDMLLGIEQDGKKVFTIEGIVNIIESGVSISELGDLTDQARERIALLKKTIKEPIFDIYGGSTVQTGTEDVDVSLSTEEQEAAFARYGEALNLAFSDQNYDAAYRIINDVFGERTPEAVRQINLLSNSLGLLNSTTAATALTEQSKLVDKLLKLPEDISKGNFDNYAELVEEFGFDVVNGILQGGTASLGGFFEEERSNFIARIQQSIANIRAQREAISGVGAALLDSEQDQVDSLLLMIDYYDRIAGVEQLRIATLKEIKDIVKETNDLYSLQERLLAGGMSGTDSFIGILNELIKISESNALGILKNQLDEDLDALAGLGEFGEDGIFIPNADNIGLVQTKIQNMIGTITELVDIQTAAYNRQKKEIEDRYKTEIDEIKKAHDDKWSEIDYNEKLLKSEEDIIAARRQLLGLAVSGSSRGEYQDAQKALEKLQREREKIIETQMLEEAQAKLELDMDKDLIAAQKDFTDAIKEYTDQLLTLGERELEDDVPPPPPGDNTNVPGTGGGGGGQDTNPNPTMTVAQMMANIGDRIKETAFEMAGYTGQLAVLNTDSELVSITGDLVGTNTTLNEGIIMLNDTMKKGFKVTLSDGSIDTDYDGAM